MHSTHPETIHYTQLAPARQSSPLAAEWETYRREVGRLLAEGHEGKTVLIKGTTIIGVYDSWDAATQEGYRRYLREGFFVKMILTQEPLLRLAN
jgi:hypothetical protein